MVKFFAFEGADGVGKSSLVDGVKTVLEQKNIKVGVYKEPIITAPFENFYKDFLFREVDNTTLFFLFLANRNEGLKKLKQMLKENDVVLADRYFLSTIVYQVQNQGHLKSIMDSFLLHVKAPLPNTWFYIDGISLEAIQDRLKDKEKDYLESNLTNQLEMFRNNLPENTYHINFVDSLDKKIQEVSEYILKSSDKGLKEYV